MTKEDIRNEPCLGIGSKSTPGASGLRLRTSTPAGLSPLVEIDKNNDRTYYPPVSYVDAGYQRSRLATTSRRLITVVVFLAATVLAVVAWSLISQARDRWYWNHADMSWTWDHNIYVHATNDDEAERIDISTKRTLLLVQQATSMNVAKIVDVTSRINRAYAKQWGIDYVRLDGSMSAAGVLRNLLRMKASSKSLPSSSRYSNDMKRDYDVVVMLDADAMVVDMDYNILDLFAPGFLIGTIGGKRDGDGSTVELNDGAGIMFWNLNHEEIGPLSKLWRDELHTSFERGLIVDESSVLANVLSNTYSTRELKTLAQPLSPSQVSYFSGNKVRFMRKPSEAVQKTSWLDTDWQDVAIVLEQTADAVCFKFFPKCDVL